ncbi:hypothetical protein M2277_004940 [Paenibacillus sp. LBL]|uniref:hypothetical protein n=1 Tax=Paenibacillus sp. LBL TaxID=2940563 RepID=UPI002473B41E|nr:hypothetical protein [Paenibacillus sp. LBL]MDH6674248.1 hypothetical protein [Paenibacillus sp. LBL]
MKIATNMKDRDEIIKSEAKKKKAMEKARQELNAINNVVTGTAGKKLSENKRKNLDKQPVHKNSGAIINKRKNSEKHRNKLRTSLPRVRDEGRRWRGWRDSDGVKSEVVTYSLADLEKNKENS